MLPSPASDQAVLAADSKNSGGAELSKEKRSDLSATTQQGFPVGQSVKTSPGSSYSAAAVDRALQHQRQLYESQEHWVIVDETTDQAIGCISSEPASLANAPSPGLRRMYVHKRLQNYLIHPHTLDVFVRFALRSQFNQLVFTSLQFKRAHVSFHEVSVHHRSNHQSSDKGGDEAQANSISVSGSTMQFGDKIKLEMLEELLVDKQSLKSLGMQMHKVV